MAMLISLTHVRIYGGYDRPDIATSPDLPMSTVSSASSALWAWADNKIRELRARSQPAWGTSREVTCECTYADGERHTYRLHLDGATTDDAHAKAWREKHHGYSRADWPLSLHARFIAYTHGDRASLDILRDYDLGPTHDDVLAPLRVHSAIRFTPGRYLRQCLRQRVQGPHASGSVFTAPTHENELLHMLCGAAWKPYTHKDVLPGCTAFEAPLEGRTGVVSLDQFAPSKRIITLADPKGTGDLSAHVPFAEVGTLEHAFFSVIILGPNEEEPEEPEMVWTFHPGAPVRPSMTKVTPGVVSELVTVSEARDRGFQFAKVTR